MEGFLFSEICIYIFLGIVGICFLIQLYYYIFIYLKVGTRKNKINANIKELSVLLCIRNESHNLQVNLPKILEQNFPRFEVIVVDDSSTDDSQDVLKELANKYKNLEIRKLQTTEGLVHSKSIVLGVGIKATKYKHIVLCDANCSPTSNNWLKSLASGLEEGKDVAISYTRTKGRLLYRAERFFEAIGELGFAIIKKPYTNNGENSIFNKGLFFDNNGFKFSLEKNDKVEKVFFNSIMTSSNTSVVLSDEAINESSLSLSFRNWRRDKKKAIISLRLFQTKNKYKRSIEIVSRIIFLPTVIFAIYLTMKHPWLWMLALSMLVIRQLVQLFVFFKTQKRLGEKGLLAFSILWDFMSPFAYTMAFMTRKAKW